MANNTLIQVPNDLTDPNVLNRFLHKLVIELDTAFSHRGTDGFATSSIVLTNAKTLEGAVDSINDLVNTFLLLDSSNLTDTLIYKDTPTLTEPNSIPNKSYVDSIITKQQAITDLPLGSTLDETIGKLNELINVMRLSTIIAT